MILKKIKDSFNSSLISNFFSLVILQGANYIFPLLTVPYLFRTLGVETFGLVNFATAFTQYFLIFTDFGFDLSATKYIAANRDNEHKRNSYFVNVLLSKFFLFFTGFIILLVIVFSFERFYVNKELYLLSYGSVLGTVLLPTWFFQGMEQMKYITKITILIRSISIIPIFFFVRSDSDYLLIPVFYNVGSIVAGLTALYYAYYRFGASLNLRKEFRINNIIQTLKDSFEFFISRISLSLYTISNSFVLGLVLGNTAVGYYTAAEKLFVSLQSLYSPLNQALYPYMIKNKNISVFKKIFIGIVVLNCIGIPLLIFEADLIMKIIYKSVDIDSSNVLKILLGTCLITVPSVLLGYPLLGAFGFTRYTNLTVIISSLFHVLMLVLLVLSDNLTIYTVAGLVVFTELIVLLLRVIGVKKYML